MIDSESKNAPGSGTDKAHPEAESGPSRLDPDSLSPRSTRLPEPTSLVGRPVVDSQPPLLEPMDEESSVIGGRRRSSLLDALQQRRTTWHEVGKAAQRLSLYALGLAEARHAVRQLVLAFVLGLALALMVALVFAGGTLRLTLGILAGTCITALGVFAALRLTSKLALRKRARSLPGSPWLWVGAVVCVAVAGTSIVSVSIWEVTKPGRAVRLRSAEPPSVPSATVVEALGAQADVRLKRGVHIGLERGVLYVPTGFAAPDGQFDLVIHYHGNVELIEKSVEAAKLNAMVAIVNLGDGSDVYSKALLNPYVFDRMLETIEARAESRLGLDRPRIRRIALSAWSAGFASVSRILNSRSRFDRVDAVLLMDAPHASYAPGSKEEVYLPGLKHFLAFAERAKAGERLMIITHSAIQTDGYPSTTLTVDALLRELDMQRGPAVASPAAVDLPVAKRAFPTGERNWLKVENHVQVKNLLVYGCTGNGKGDHIAHLAQMSVTVLPPLQKRWTHQTPSRAE